MNRGIVRVDPDLRGDANQEGQEIGPAFLPFLALGLGEPGQGIRIADAGQVAIHLPHRECPRRFLECFRVVAVNDTSQATRSALIQSRACRRSLA